VTRDITCLMCRLAAASALIVVLASCTTDVDAMGEEEEPKKRTVPLKLPKKRLPRKEEDKLLDIIDELRDADSEYLERIKAEEIIAAAIAKGQIGALDYVVQLLDDPKWDVRAAALRIIVKHGRSSPAAVSVLVQVIGDPAMNAAVRDDAVRALRGWTGKYFGYNAWSDPRAAKAAVAKWKAWLEETGGVIEDAE